MLHGKLTIKCSLPLLFILSYNVFIFNTDATQTRTNEKQTVSQTLD